MVRAPHVALKVGGARPMKVVMEANTDKYETINLVSSDAESVDKESYVIVKEEGTNEIVDIYFIEDEDEPGNEEEYEKKIGSKDQQNSKKRGRKPKLLGHVKHHLKCSICSYSTQKRYLLLRHLKTHNLDNTYKCSICERGFKTVYSLKNHLNMHTGARPFKCRHCDKRFNSSGQLIPHVRYMHSKEKPYACAQCDYKAVECSKLRRHNRVHTGERPYQCPHCTYSSPDNFKLKRHLRTHTGEKPYKCEQCKRCFTQSNSLKTHRYTHNVSERPVFPCELCPMTYGRKWDLRRHIQTQHTTNMLYRCTTCGNIFKDKYSLRVHSKTHKGEKTFKCEMCPYAARYRRFLEAHTLVHTGEKPFTCDHCKMRFRRKSLLCRHINLYHNPGYVPPKPRERTHECHHCGRRYAKKGNLVKHVAIHETKTVRKQEEVTKKICEKYVVKEKEISNGEFIKQAEAPPTDTVTYDEIVTVEDGKHYVVMQIVDLEQSEPDKKNKDMVEVDLSDEVSSECSKSLAKDIRTFFDFDEENESDDGKYY
ncbi:uncharacterized protein LOC142974911 [Anticarsia gemmatalis]|uniref:uncharacterized protein LOC142974911 n=1 Tax=Anticarsia gemmatalis TaxID=129554 RepID=UPI003F76305B